MEPAPKTPPQTPPQTPPAPAADLSKRTIVVLVILSCSISVIGVIAMAYEFSNARVAPVIVENGGTSSAQSSFTLLDPNAAPAAQPVGSNVAAGTGKAAFELKERG